MNTLLAIGLAGPLQAPRKIGDSLVTIGHDQLGYARLTLEDVDKHELLLHQLVISQAAPVTVHSLTRGFHQLNRDKEMKLAGEGAAADVWCTNEATKTSMLFQYATRFLKRANFSRSVAINRLKTVWRGMENGDTNNHAASHVETVADTNSHDASHVETAEDVEASPVEALVALPEVDPALHTQASPTVLESSQEVVGVGLDCLPSWREAWNDDPETDMETETGIDGEATTTNPHAAADALVAN